MGNIAIAQLRCAVIRMSHFGEEFKEFLKTIVINEAYDEVAKMFRWFEKYGVHHP